MLKLNPVGCKKCFLPGGHIHLHQLLQHCWDPPAPLQAPCGKATGSQAVLHLAQPLLSVKGCGMQNLNLTPLFFMSPDPVSDRGRQHCMERWARKREKQCSSFPCDPSFQQHFRNTHSATALFVPCEKAQFGLRPKLSPCTDQAWLPGWRVPHCSHINPPACQQLGPLARSQRGRDQEEEKGSHGGCWRSCVHHPWQRPCCNLMVPVIGFPPCAPISQPHTDPNPTPGSQSQAPTRHGSRGL